MRNALAAAAAALLGLFPLTGCSSTRDHARAFELPENVRAIAVDAENFRGNVTVRVIPYQDDVRVEGAVCSATAVVESADQPGAGEVGITSALEQEGDLAVLRVRSAQGSPENRDQRADLVITLPRCEGVRVSSAEGDVMIVGASGAAEITNRDGAIEIRTDKPMTDPVTLMTVNGNIYYQVPKGSTGQFDLATLDGECAFRNKVGETNETRATREAFTTTLNDGGNPIVARTNKGDVRVWVIEEPMALVRMYKKTPVDPRDGMFLSGHRRYTRNLPNDEPQRGNTQPLPREFPGY